MNSTSHMSKKQTNISKLPNLPSDIQKLIFKLRNEIKKQNRKSKFNAYNVKLHALPNGQTATTIRAVNNQTNSIQNLIRSRFPYAMKENDMVRIFPGPRKYFSQHGYVLLPFFNNLKGAREQTFKIFPHKSRRVKHHWNSKC